MPSIPKDKLTKKEIEFDLKIGVSKTRIAKDLGVSIPTLNLYIKKQGLKK